MLTAIQATEKFEAIIPVFRESWKLAWRDMVSTYNDPNWDNRCRSTVIQMQAVNHAKELTMDNPDINHLNFDSRHLFLFQDQWLFGLKQLDDRHCSKNFPTPAALAFAKQQELAGLEAYPRYTIGLLPNPDWTDYIGVFLTYPKATGQNNWVLNITGAPVDIESLQSEFNEPISQPERRFRPIRRAGEERSGESGI